MVSTPLQPRITQSSHGQPSSRPVSASYFCNQGSAAGQIASTASVCDLRQNTKTSRNSHLSVSHSQPTHVLPSHLSVKLLSSHSRFIQLLVSTSEWSWILAMGSAISFTKKQMPWAQLQMLRRARVTVINLDDDGDYCLMRQIAARHSSPSKLELVDHCRDIWEYKLALPNISFVTIAAE